MTLGKYLTPNPYIDFDKPEVKARACALAKGAVSKESIAKTCYEFVRDEIKHSWDFQLNPVTISASKVLQYRTGYCYAKSHLLAALLRANHILAALCYQRLTITNKPPYCLHGLNAVYLDDFGWYKVDARGNSHSINAQFNPPEEKLAFDFKDRGERAITGLFAEPAPQIIPLLESCDTVKQVYQRLTETDKTI